MRSSGSKRKQREVGLRTIVIRVPKPEFSAQMAEMRKWLAKHRFDPSQFTSKPYENIVSVYVQFENDHEAEAFKAQFKAQEDGQNRIPCRYFLMNGSGRSVLTMRSPRTKKQLSRLAGGG